MASWQSAVFRGVLYGLSGWVDRATLAQLRAAQTRGAARVIRDADIRHQIVEAGGVRAEWFAPPGAVAGPILLYLHGGGWALGLSVAHYRFLPQLSRQLGMRVLAVDYRLVPEHPFPAGLDDCRSVYHWLLKAGQQPGDIVVGGDSAGGNFTLALMLALKSAGEPLPAASVCLSPAVDLTGTRPATHVPADPMLPRRFAERLRQGYIRDLDPAQPLVSPLFGDLRGLPPLLIQVGGAELLLSDAQRLAERARAAGVETTLQIYPGMWHVWQLFAPYLPEAQQALNAIVCFVRQHVRAAVAA